MMMITERDGTTKSCYSFAANFLESPATLSVGESSREMQFLYYPKKVNTRNGQREDGGQFQKQTDEDG